jgi:hypothetical protein
MRVFFRLFFVSNCADNVGMSKTLPVLLFFAISGLSIGAAPVYKSEDEFGRPVFTDQGVTESEEVKIRETTTYSNDAAPTYAPRKPRKSPTPEAFQYIGALITSPENETVVRDNAGNLQLTIKVVPGISPGHRLQLLRNGEVFRELTNTGPVALQNVDRGTHTFSVQIVDKDTSKVLFTGPSTTVTLLRHSIRH